MVIFNSALCFAFVIFGIITIIQDARAVKVECGKPSPDMVWVNGRRKLMKLIAFGTFLAFVSSLFIAFN